METGLFWIVPAASVLALVLAWYFYSSDDAGERRHSPHD